MDGVPDTSSQEGSIVAASVIMLLLATFTAGLRFYTRWNVLSGLKADDWLVLAALIFSTGVSIGFIRQSALALGHHKLLVSEDVMIASNKELWYTFLFYGLSLSATKLSILLLYCKILTYGVMKTLNYIVICFVGAVSLWVIISELIQCIPLEASWDPRVQGWCLGLTVQLGNSVLHIVTDFIIFSLPIPAIISLQLHWKQKFGVLIVFMFGFVVCILSMVRIIFLSKLDLSMDITYNMARLAYWGVVEVNLAIICACLTTIKPLLVKWFPKLLGSSIGTYATDHDSRVTREELGRTVVMSSQHHKPRRSAFIELGDSHNNRLSTSEEGSMEFIIHDLEARR